VSQGGASAPTGPLAAARQAVLDRLAPALRSLGWSTLRRMALHAAVWAAAFLAAAAIVYRLGIDVETRHAALRLLGAVTIFPVYGLVGAACGLLFAITGALRRGLAEVESALHQLVGPLMAGVTAAMFQGRTSVSLDEFDAILDRQVRELAQGARSRLGRISPGGLLFGRVLQVAKMVLRRRLARRLAEAGTTRITPEVVERFASEKVVGMALAGSGSRIAVLRGLVYIVAAVFLLGPVALLLMSS